MGWREIVKENDLSVTEILVSELGVGMRLEAEFYVSGSVSNGSFSGADIIDVAQYGTSKGLNEDHLGFPVLRLNEFEMAFSGVPEKYCDLLSENEFEALKLKKGDVLICRTNGNPKYVGKAAMVMEDVDYAFASYLFRIKTNASIKPSVLVAYLNSKSGRKEVEKYSIVSNQANFSPAKFRQISIPEIPTILQEKVDDLFSESWACYKESTRVHKEVEELLLKEIALEGYVPNKQNTSIRKLNECLADDRFDAEYWEPRFDEMEKRVSAIPQKELGDIVSMQKGIEPGSEAYTSDGKAFIRVSDISVYGIESGDKKISDKLYDKLKENYKPQKGEVLFTKDGTIGISFALDENIEAVVSGAFLRLKPKIKINNDYLALVLNSIYCKFQIERMSGGAIIAHLKPENVKKIKIPILSDAKQEELAEKATSSLRLRNEAKELLEKAKRAVEIFIEKDEPEALKYLTS